MTLYNRYNARTGSYLSVPEPGDAPRTERRSPPAPEPRPRPPAAEPPPARRQAQPSLSALLGALGGRLNGRLGGLDTEDMLLLAVVYLMYRESGDRQLLIVLAALLLT